MKSHHKWTRREFLKYNILSGLLAGFSPSILLGGCSKKQISEWPNIILITLDTTRVDHLSCYGYHRRTSPNIDKLSQESKIYDFAIAPSSWTLPSHASLFTGKFTTSHGAKYDPEGPLSLSDAETGTDGWKHYNVRGLSQNETTLAQILNNFGYITGASVGGPWMKKIFGLNKGFQFYDDTGINILTGKLGKHVTDSALKWLATIENQKFFLFMNYFDPHGPFMPPDGFAGSFLPPSTNLNGREFTLKETIALYDAEILYMDYYIGQLIKKLKADGLYEKTMIIVTADHGELFGEHGKYGHGSHLYQEEIHVPLLIKYPGKEISPQRTDAPVQLNDIMAIIFERLGITMPSETQSGIPPAIKHPILSETYPLPSFSRDGHARVIIDENYKLTWSSLGNNLLINLKDDPDEKFNILTDEPDQMVKMMAYMDSYLTALPEPKLSLEKNTIDKETIKALKSLGYMN